MATRAIWCIIISRSIRTVAFMLTVLPSQRPGCYARRFPPVPDTWQSFLAVGFSKLRASGGCNDLVISGHATIYTVVPIAYGDYYDKWTAALLWYFVLRTCLRVRPPSVTCHSACCSRPPHARKIRR